MLQGVSWGGSGGHLGPKMRKSDVQVIRWTPPWPPKVEPKSTQNRHVGVPEGTFADHSVTFGCVFEGSRFRPVF